MKHIINSLWRETFEKCIGHSCVFVNRRFLYQKRGWTYCLVWFVQVDLLPKDVLGKIVTYLHSLIKFHRNPSLPHCLLGWVSPRNCFFSCLPASLPSSPPLRATWLGAEPTSTAHCSCHCISLTDSESPNVNLQLRLDGHTLSVCYWSFLLTVRAHFAGDSIFHWMNHPQILFSSCPTKGFLGSIPSNLSLGHHQVNVNITTTDFFSKPPDNEASLELFSSLQP